MVSRGKAEQQAARTARLSAALRENLKRRKAQARSRTGNNRDDEDLTVADKIESKVPDFRRNPGRD
jgi:polysaccharide pyruvyl transferase WcaK-like protein